VFKSSRVQVERIDRIKMLAPARNDGVVVIGFNDFIAAESKRHPAPLLQRHLSAPGFERTGI
jgi:hypothetical protein